MNNKLQEMVFITDSGDSELEEEVLIDKKEFLSINKSLKEEGLKIAKSRKTKPATFNPLLMGLHKHH